MGAFQGRRDLLAVGVIDFEREDRRTRKRRIGEAKLGEKLNGGGVDGVGMVTRKIVAPVVQQFGERLRHQDGGQPPLAKFGVHHYRNELADLGAGVTGTGVNDLAAQHGADLGAARQTQKQQLAGGRIFAPAGGGPDGGRRAPDAQG